MSSDSNDHPGEDDQLPTEGRLAGIDFGTVRIGVAVSDPEQRISSPLENYSRRTEELDSKFFQGLMAEERVVGFVVGLPVHMSGDESEKSKEARAFGAWLTEQTGAPVVFQDERFSSTLADDLMMQANVRKKSRKQRRDALAAHVILSGYLEWRSSRDDRTD